MMWLFGDYVIKYELYVCEVTLRVTIFFPLCLFSQNVGL